MSYQSSGSKTILRQWIVWMLTFDTKWVCRYCKTEKEAKAYITQLFIDSGNYQLILLTELVDEWVKNSC